MKQRIMVVKRDSLLWENSFNGFKSHTEYDFIKKINWNFVFEERWKVETNPEFKQPIVYGVIINPETKEVFAYQRTNTHNENRLDNKRSWWVWWHVDFDNYLDGSKILEQNMARELEEEVNLKNDYKIKILGYINDDTNPVGEVHFWVVYLIETEQKIQPHSKREILKWDFYSISDMEKIIESKDVESWSWICFTAVRDYLFSL